MTGIGNDMFGKTNESWLIVGLGNPGREYEKTRHNAGFRCLDLLAESLGCRIDKLKYQGLYCQTTYNGAKLFLLKPQTYMNLSGRSVLQLSSYFNIPPARIIVLFDDISLPPGRLRIRADGSAGGHNGIKSIIQELGSQAFPRVKIGVGGKAHPDQDLADHVLSGFSALEEKALAVALKNGADAALAIIDKGVPEAANRFNGSHP
jgi:PTH1 family peptidyl-tRNA hydrolase